MHRTKVDLIIDHVEQVCVIVGSIALIIMMFLTSTDAISRHFFSHAIPGVLEFVEEYSMIPLIFLPLSYVYMKGGHVKVELFERFFSESQKEFLEIFNALISFVFFALLTVATYPTVIQAIQINEVSNSVLAYPLAPSYAMVTFGSLLICIRTAQVLIKLIIAKVKPNIGDE